MRIVFPDEAPRIVIRARDNSWGNMGKVYWPNSYWNKSQKFHKYKHTTLCLGSSRDGKQKYIASAAAELGRNMEMEITRNTTLLIDDDSSNIEAALSNSVRAILFQPDRVESLFQDILTFLDTDDWIDLTITYCSMVVLINAGLDHCRALSFILYLQF